MLVFSYVIEYIAYWYSLILMQCADCTHMSYAHAYNVMYDIVYSARTLVPTHHTQLYFIIESGRRTLILIQCTVYNIIYLLIVNTDICTVPLSCRVTVLTVTQILLLILTLTLPQHVNCCKLLNIHISYIPCFDDVCALRTWTQWTMCNAYTIPWN